jgi:hypothetical protein
MPASVKHLNAAAALRWTAQLTAAQAVPPELGVANHDCCTAQLGLQASYDFSLNGGCGLKVEADVQCGQRILWVLKSQAKGMTH